MAISQKQVEGFTLPELEYLAQTEPTTIVPFYRMDRLELVGGPIGPFRPPQKTKVPLWVATILKKSNHCRIVPPLWLDYDALSAQCREEEKPQSLFTNLPTHYIEIAHALLSIAEDDIPDSQNIRRAVQDIREVRQSKTRQGFAMLNSTQLQMDNLALAEINEIRPLFAHAFDMLAQFGALADIADSAKSGIPNEDSQYSENTFGEFSSSYM